MAEAYLTFKGTTAGIADAFYPTQALADAGAVDADITAVQGVQTIPDDYRPNKAYWDGTALLEEVPALVLFNALSATDKLKTVSRQLHDAYCTLAMRLEDPLLAGYFQALHRDWAHDFLAMAHRGTRGVMLADSSNISTAQKLAWAVANGAGPTDVPPTNRAAFFEVVEDWAVDSAFVPTEAVLFAHPTTAERWTLADCKGMTGGDDVKNLLAAETTDFSIYVGGSWIDGITA